MKQPPKNVSRLAPTGTAVIAWSAWRSSLLGLLVATP